MASLAQPKVAEAAFQHQGADLIASDIDAYLKQHENKQLLRFLTCGNVDDGKSTLIGRLLHDSKMIYEDQLEALHRDSKTQGTTGSAPDLALLVDGLQAEREQGITIDVAYRYFSTAKRKFIIADTPGHEQYTRNMATGASNCDLAIILIDARKGVQLQTRRHSYLVSLLGIRHVIVAVNKMDLVDYSAAVFAQIQADYLAFAQQLNLPELHFVPLSALQGDNVVSPSDTMSWYNGLPLMGLLETLEVGTTAAQAPLRFPVQYVNRPNLNFRGYCGTLAAGQIQVGDQIRVLPSGLTSTVKELIVAPPITQPNNTNFNVDSAFAGQAITLTLKDEIDISRGDLIVAAHEQPQASKRLEAEVVWLTEQPLLPGTTYWLKLGTRQVNARINSVYYTTNVNTQERQPAATLELNEIARVELLLEQPVVADTYQTNRATGSFILIDRLTKNTVAAGMVQTSNPAANQTDTSTATTATTPVSSAERAARLGQQAAIIELHGGSAASNAALLLQLERSLFNLGRLAVVVDTQQINPALLQQQAALTSFLLEQGLLVLSGQPHPAASTTANQDNQLQLQIKQGANSWQLDFANTATLLSQFIAQLHAKNII